MEYCGEERISKLVDVVEEVIKESHLNFSAYNSADSL
jgi:hypothetical protein